VSRVIKNDGLDFKSASAGPGAIVYEQFGSLNLYDLAAGKASPLPVSIAGDPIEVRDKFVNVGDSLESPSLSPSGARAAFEARGEIITVPEEKGDARNLTNTPGAMERSPSWSLNGQKIAYFSDESGEYQLYVRDQKGDGPAVRIDLEKKPTFYFSPTWSPDGQKIAYEDCHLNLWYVDLEKKTPVKVDRDRFRSGRGSLVPRWSPDSKWLAYVKHLPNYLGAVFLYSLETGRNTQLTDGMSDAGYPVFDAGGNYLFFTASTDSGASYQPDIHSIFRDVSSTIYLAVLDKTEPTPFAPQSDEEKPEDKSKKTTDEAVRKEGEKKEESAVAVKIDFEGLLQRILAVPMPARRYVNLQAGEAGTLLAVAVDPPLPGTLFSQAASVHRFDLKERRADVIVSGVDFFELAGGGKKYLYSQRGSWRIGTLKPMPPAGAPVPPPAPGPGSDKTMPTQDIEVRVKPLEEWRQMFREVWRIEREFFYDPNLHGLDLDWVQKEYAPFVEAVASRADLNYLFADMLGEMTVGHLGAGGGDIPRPDRVSTGLLGADYTIENGRYRFARVYSGENWNPQLQAPLTQPGVNVKAGEYLLAVDGRELKGTDNIHSFFEAKAGKQVVLTVGPEPRLEGSREVTVVAVGSEMPLRNSSWIEDNRRYVERVTNGKAAYVYMPDTAFGGYTYFNRYFYAQVGRDALIVDERFNAGGMLATDIIERFGRKMMSLVATRDGEDEVQPQGAIFGPKVMLINEFAGSGGDAMPWYFQRAKVGPLVGKRTWGGLVGMAGAPALMDGGFVTAPGAGVWSPDGHWVAENIGVIPDVEVELDPALVRQGKDPQLDKAVEIVMEELAKNPPLKPKRPPYPDYHKK
jgi:tricorn protease